MDRALVIHRRKMSKKIKIVKVKQRERILDVTETTNKQRTTKNKGNQINPKNFRPINILSCLSKLFTAVLSERLTNFSDAFLLLNENQCGFRRGYSAIDNLFIHPLKF